MTRLPPLSGEPVPAWDTRDLAERECFACGSATRETLCERPDGLEVARCGECGAVYLPRVPSAAQLERFYAGYAERKRYLQPPGGRRGFGLGRLLRRVTGRTPISPYTEVLVRTSGVSGKIVVELGPGGAGGVLHEVRRLGAQAMAVEVDPVAAARLREAGFAVHARVAEIAGQADVVVASMVLEHVADPRGLLDEVSRLTRPGARVVVGVPIAGQATTIGPAWVGFRVDLEHLNYFDTRTLSRLLGEAGFLTECFWESSQPFLPEYQALADRRAFFAAVRARLGRAAFAPVDPMASGGFQLTLLARRDEKERDDGGR